MSSIMRRRSGLMGLALAVVVLIGVLLVFEVGVTSPLDPQDRALPIPLPPAALATVTHAQRSLARHRLAPSAFVPWPTTALSSCSMRGTQSSAPQRKPTFVPLTVQCKGSSTAMAAVPLTAEPDRAERGTR